MSELDPLHALLREWPSAEPTSEMDTRIATAYRNALRHPPIWLRFLRARVSIPAPALAIGILAAVAVFLLFRGATAPHPLPATHNLITQLNASGFQPLPNGEARVISVKELKK